MATHKRKWSHKWSGRLSGNPSKHFLLGTNESQSIFWICHCRDFRPDAKKKRISGNEVFFFALAECHPTVCFSQRIPAAFFSSLHHLLLPFGFSVLARRRSARSSSFLLAAIILAKFSNFNNATNIRNIHGQHDRRRGPHQCAGFCV